MTCWLTRRRLGAYRDGELPGPARLRVEAHVAWCPGCRAELTQLERLRAALAGSVAEPLPATWDAFWPQVRARIASAPAPVRVPRWRRVWAGVVDRPRLALAPALAAASLAILAVMAPWQRGPERPPGPAPVAAVSTTPGMLDEIVIQSIETADPDLPVMVYSSPESDLTVLWVFGLEPTGT
jgi:anti-sigma factor RsiW